MATSTVEAEVADNLYKMVEVFQKQTGVQPHIMMDNCITYVFRRTSEMT